MKEPISIGPKDLADILEAFIGYIGSKLTDKDIDDCEDIFNKIQDIFTESELTRAQGMIIMASYLQFNIRKTNKKFEKTKIKKFQKIKL